MQEVRRDGGGFGRLVRGHRARRGITQRQLADLSTMSVRAIRDLEQERVLRPRRETVRLIADALRLEPDTRAQLERTALRERRRALQEEADDPAAPPPALAPLIAREVETEALEETLRDDSGRLVTLTGLPGIGKTRVALEVAARLYRDGDHAVLWASGPRSSGAHGRPAGDGRLHRLPERVAGTLFGLSRGEGAERARAEVAALARERPVLLVLDGSGAGCRPDPEAMAALLADCPGLRILGTAPRAFRVPGERNFTLGPLDLPSGADESGARELERVASVRLLMDRIGAVRPEYRLCDDDVPIVADICRKADGVPFALVALAPWLAVLDLPGLLRALSEDPFGLLAPVGGAGDAHQGAYRDAVERSAEGLGPVAEDLLGWLCASGPVGLERAAAEFGASAAECGAWMRTLVAAGLVRVEHRSDGIRFSALHLVRALGRETAPRAGTPGPVQHVGDRRH